MFTGIVTTLGRVRRARTRRGNLTLEIEAPSVARELRVGDSVAVDGVCLTATGRTRKSFTADVMAETLARSTLGSTSRGARVNLELAARPIDRLGGHLVQGHVDGIAAVTRIEEPEGMRWIWLSTSEELLHYMVPKGSVALDGVSLTLVDVGKATFSVALIPHTSQSTTLGAMAVGDRANVEVDLIAKYVDRLVARPERAGRTSL